MQSGDSRTIVLESAATESQQRQEDFKQKQLAALEKQKQLIEDARQKNLALRPIKSSCTGRLLSIVP